MRGSAWEDDKKKRAYKRHDNKEYIISQYADDTQLLLDGPVKNLLETLRILERYYKLSGLKINGDKKKPFGLEQNSFRMENYVPTIT